MRDLLTRPTRRGFLGRLTAAGAAAALSLRGGPLAALAPASPRSDEPLPPLPPGDWDMRWVEQLHGNRRQLFDAPALADGIPLHQVSAWMQGYTDVYGTSDSDVQPVLVIRHFAIPMALDDAAWDRWQLGQVMAGLVANKQPVKDPASGEPARRNPYLNANVRPGDRFASMYVWPTGGLDSLIRRGAIVLGCDLALQYIASNVVVPAEKIDAAAAHTMLKSHVLPGVFVMPSGIFAVGRAEEAGCQYIYAG